MMTEKELQELRKNLKKFFSIFGQSLFPIFEKIENKLTHKMIDNAICKIIEIININEKDKEYY